MVTTLALIPARAGSKGIPGKNTRKFRGKPLMAWAIEAAQNAGLDAYVSTEDVYAQRIAHQYGAKVIARPKALATDETPMLDVVRHAASAKTFDVLVLLQPTQPLRTPEHIRAALKLLEETGADSVVSVVEVPAHYRPEYVCQLEYGPASEPGVVRLVRPPAVRRQDAADAHSRDGTVYAIKRETIEAGSLYGNDCRALVIPRSESVNLDTEEDWALAEAMVTA